MILGRMVTANQSVVSETTNSNTEAIADDTVAARPSKLWESVWNPGWLDNSHHNIGLYKTSITEYHN